MAGFGQNKIHLRVMPLALGDVVEQDQDLGAIVIGMNEASSIDQEGALPDAGKIVFHLETDDSRRSRNDAGDQLAKFTNIPLAIAEIEEAFTEEIVPLHLERLDEGVVGGGDAEPLVEDDDRLGHRIDHALGLDMPGPQQAVKVL